MKEQVLNIGLFLDGRPGHEKQSYGILRALQELVTVRCVEVKVVRPRPLERLGQLLKVMLPIPEPVSSRLDDVDFLLGTGTSTHLPMLMQKKRLGIPVVTCMTPDRYLLNRFDLCCVPEHDNPRLQRNIFPTVGAPNLCSDKGLHQAEKGLILLGGVDSHSHSWDTTAIVSMVERILVTNPQRNWAISSSPRTPSDTVEQLERCIADYLCAIFYDYNETPRGWVEEQYDKSSVVWVTSDSISMIYEALTAGCRVGLLPVNWKKRNNKFQRNEEILTRKGLVQQFPGGLSETEQEARGLRPVQTRLFNEARRCAEKILELWWQNKD